LIVFIDDATSELMLLRFVLHETSYNYMACLKSYIERFGCPLALFSDRHSIFRATRPTKTGERTQTQFARACSKLDITVIISFTRSRILRSRRGVSNARIERSRIG
jgi:hypothetical protein